MNRRPIWLLCICAVCFLECTRHDTPLHYSDRSIVPVSRSYDSKHINECVRISTTFTEADLKSHKLIRLIDSSFKKNADPNLILFGRHKSDSPGWIFFRLVNVDAEALKLMLEPKQKGFERLETYIIKNDTATSLYVLKRNSNVYEREVPLLYFGIPVVIQARDTLDVLIRSENHLGPHSLSIEVSDYPKFVKRVITKSWLGLIRILFAIIVMVVSLTVGWYFKSKPMIYYGFLIFMILNLVLAFEGYFDMVKYVSGRGLGASNIASLFIFLSNALFLPFGYEMFKKYARSIGNINLTTSILFGVNIGFATAYFLPAKYFWMISPYIEEILTVVCTLNFVYMFYFSVRVYLSVGSKNYLYAALLTLLPVFYRVLLDRPYFLDNDPFVIRYYYTSILVIVAMTFILVQLIRTETISKRKYRTAMKYMQEVRNEEIQKIGRDLHDQVGNTLASALGYLGAKENKPEKVKALIMNSINELRLVSHNLVKDRSKPLTEMVSSLVDRFNDFSTTEFRFEDFSNGWFDTLSMVRQQNVYGIIQEAISNITRHANASEVYVYFYNDGKDWSISVEDDGKGFDINAHYEGIGLSNIRKRAELASVSVYIDSTPKGTSIIIKEKDEKWSNYNRRS